MNWLQKIAQPYFEAVAGLEENLLELFKTEYALSELKRRGHLNQRLTFSKRYEHWLAQMQDHALDMAENEVGPQVLEHLQKWLNSHSPHGFGEMVMGLIEEELGSSINDEGTVELGGGFQFQLGDGIIEAFLRANPSFVEQVISEEDPDYWVQSGENPEDWNDERKLEHVKDSMEGFGYNFSELRNWLSQWGDFDTPVLSLIQQQVYPAWRAWWGEQIEIAEMNVGEAAQRLEQALSSNDLGQLLAAINISLNAEHVHGGMFEHMYLEQSLLDQLSNLETEPLDAFVDNITGSNWKTAHNWLRKTSKVDPVVADPEEMGYKPEWGEHHGPVTYTPDHWNYGPKGYYSPPIPIPQKLYHATPYPDEILDHGFVLPKDLGKKTFGGGDEFMSFSSFENAVLYQNVIQDLARVANGEFDQMEPVAVLQHFGEKWKVDPESITRLYRDMVGDRERSPQKAALHFFGYIHNYEGGRHVPFLFGNKSVLDHLRGINPDQVGVIEVETQPLQWHKGTNVFQDTDMTQNYTYNRHENEWRIYDPNGIRPVRRVA